MAMTGALLLLSASILWIGLGFAVALGEGGDGESNSIGNVFAIITLLNAALFYLMGLGAIKKASKKTNRWPGCVRAFGFTTSTPTSSPGNLKAD